MFSFQYSVSKGVSLVGIEIKRSLLSKTEIVYPPLPFSVCSQLLAVLLLRPAVHNQFVVYRQGCNWQGG